MDRVKKKSTQKNWDAYSAMLALNLSLLAFFIAGYHDTNSIVFTATIVFLCIFIMPPMYDKIVNNKILILWLVINVCLMAVWLYQLTV